MSGADVLAQVRTALNYPVNLTSKQVKVQENIKNNKRYSVILKYRCIRYITIVINDLIAFVKTQCNSSTINNALPA